MVEGQVRDVDRVRAGFVEVQRSALGRDLVLVVIAVESLRMTTSNPARAWPRAAGRREALVETEMSASPAALAGSTPNGTNKSARSRLTARATGLGSERLARARSIEGTYRKCTNDGAEAGLTSDSPRPSRVGDAGARGDRINPVVDRSPPAEVRCFQWTAASAWSDHDPCATRFRQTRRAFDRHVLFAQEELPERRIKSDIRRTERPTAPGARSRRPLVVQCCVGSSLGSVFVSAGACAPLPAGRGVPSGMHRRGAARRTARKLR